LIHCVHPSPPNSWADNHVPVEYLPGIWNGSLGEQSELPELRALQRIKGADVPLHFVALAGDARHFVALDYSQGKTTEPKVVFWQQIHQDAIDIAPNMQSFLAGLCDEDSLPVVAQAPAAVVEELAEEDDGWNMAALLGDDLEDDEEDVSFEGGGVVDEDDEEIVDGEEGPEHDAGFEEEQTLPPGKRARNIE
jgi:hypothetical protein